VIAAGTHEHGYGGSWLASRLTETGVRRLRNSG
jgi:hypothetical protein